mmetsp:Transcript_55815/g.157250  ORF Transcript_55815/g.157250 Transcript_55815/m.157250 type:complete len:104 (-) Transcript_55815:120-431(-)
MFFASPVLLRSKSKRLAVCLVSSVQTGMRYWTEKSPLKKDTRMALHKYDPIVNRHVMFYEALLKPVKRRFIRRKVRAWARWTGKGIQNLMKGVEKRHAKLGYF